MTKQQEGASMIYNQDKDESIMDSFVYSEIKHHIRQETAKDGLKEEFSPYHV